MPTIVFLFVYLSQLLRIGEEEAAEEVAEEFLADDREVEPVVVPRGADVSDDAWRVSTPATVGDDCRMHGNVRATDIEVGADTEIFGSLRAKEEIRIGPGTVVHGDVTTKGGDVVVGPDANVRGDISCEDCALSEAAEVDGAIRARGETNFAAVSEEFDGTAADAEATAAPTDGGTDGETATDPEVAVVPLGEGELDGETVPAVVPLSESELDWDDPAATNGDEALEGVVAEAEK